jgi:hypothetical protein
MFRILPEALVAAICEGERVRHGRQHWAVNHGLVKSQGLPEGGSRVSYTSRGYICSSTWKLPHSQEKDMSNRLVEARANLLFKSNSDFFFLGI